MANKYNDFNSCEEMEQEIHNLIREHAPENTTFYWFEKRNPLGLCWLIPLAPGARPTAFRIGISYPYALHSSRADLIDTTLHEIAHARKPLSSHDYSWKQECILLGCTPSPKADHGVPKKYIGTCPRCGEKTFRNSHPKEDYHYRCGQSAKYIWEVNPDAQLFSTKEELIENIGFVRATDVGRFRLQKNLDLNHLSNKEVDEWCRKQILKDTAKFQLKDLRCSISTDECILTINSEDYTVTTGCKAKRG